MPRRQTSVKSAYSYADDKNINSRGLAVQKLLGIAGALFCLFTVLNIGGDSSRENEYYSLRSHQAKRNETVTDEVITTVEEQTTGIVELEEEEPPREVNPNLKSIVDEVVTELEVVEEDEVKQSEFKLNDAFRSMGNSIRIELGQLLGKRVSVEEVEQMAQDVEAELRKQASDELNEGASRITENEIDEINDSIEEHERGGIPALDIEEDITGREDVAKETIISNIHDLEVQIEGSLRSRLIEIEKEVLEKRLTSRFGAPVSLSIVENEIEGVDGVLTPSASHIIPEGEDTFSQDESHDEAEDDDEEKVKSESEDEAEESDGEGNPDDEQSKGEGEGEGEGEGSDYEDSEDEEEER